MDADPVAFYAVNERNESRILSVGRDGPQGVEFELF